MKWSVLALAAVAAGLVGTSQAEAAGGVSISIGRRTLVRPATIVTPAVMPVPAVVSSPVIVTPPFVYDPLVRVGHPAYPYMLAPGRSMVVGPTVVAPTTVIGRTVVRRSYIGRSYIGRGVVVRGPRFGVAVGF